MQIVYRSVCFIVLSCPQGGELGDVDSDVAVSAKIPFELKSTDEKFLVEAAAYTSLQLSELDVCQHKVSLVVTYTRLVYTVLF